MVEVATLAAVSASPLPGIPLCPGIHKRVVGLGCASRSDLRWLDAGDRRSIALSSDGLSVQILSEFSGRLAWPIPMRVAWQLLLPQMTR